MDGNTDRGNERVAEKKKLTAEEMIYRTPMVYVVSFSAAAALALCLIGALLMLILGFGFVTTEVDGVEIRYFGVMRDGTPSFGWMRDSEGNRGFISGNRVKYSDGSRYEGERVGFYYSGEGRFTDGDGNVYTGSFYMGKLSGSVHADYADGGSFDGEYLNGLKHGYGVEKHIDENGFQWGYSGEYAEGEENGYGEFIYPDGSRYNGNFSNGMRHGEGEYRFASGDRYTGEFRNNVITGTGTYFFASGRVFSGEFVNGVPVLE